MPEKKSLLSRTDATAQILAAKQEKKYKSIIGDAVKFLKKLQWDEEEGKQPSDDFYGGAGYDSKSRPDLSNTQFFLDALKEAGVDKNDPALKKLNPGVELPDTKIVVVHRSDGSGTTYTFVDYLCKVSPEWEKKVGKGTSVSFPVGLGEKGNELVAGQVKRTEGALGYIELTYALQNKIDYGAVKNKEGVFVNPSVESVSAAAAASLKEIPDDLRYSITDAPGKDSYPISGTSWGLSYTNPPGGKGKAVHDFFYWCTHEGQQYCDALHYARLPKGLVERIEKRLELIK